MLIFKLTDRPYSLRKNLRLLVWICVFPALVVGSILAYTNYALLLNAVQQQTMLLGRSVLSELERDLAVVESGMKILGTAPELQSADLANFQIRANNALPKGVVYNYIVTDVQGRQLMNTLRPFGTPLPTSGTPAQLAQVFAARKTVLTDMFMGPVTKKPAIAMGVPVEVQGQVSYSLNIGLDPGYINEILARQPIPEGWLVAVLDSSGAVVGRSRDPERYLGEKAVPQILRAIASVDSGQLESVTKDGQTVFTAFVTSPNWRWRVVVGAPRTALYGEVFSQISLVVASLLLTIASGLWLARTISVRLLEAVQGLNRAALAMRRGEDLTDPIIRLEETEAVTEAMDQAAHVMRQVQFNATHDALTELGNRLHFEEAVQRALAQSERSGQGFAVLVLDLDGFKGVNDRFGHAAGDEVLKAAADRLREVIRAYDLAARLGGDEFAVLLGEVDTAVAMETAQRIVHALAQPYVVDAPVSASVGVAVYPQHGKDAKDLLASADKAMYQAKVSGKWQAKLA